jgi:hypothetical protein
MTVSDGQVVLYKASGGSVSLEVKLRGKTVWLSLNQMAELFKRDKSVISRHLRNVYNTAELKRNSTVAFFATVQEEGGRQVERRIEYYNLDAILSVGYRVNSKRGTQFRIWATRILRDHLIRGYSINERGLKELNQAIRLPISFFNEDSELRGADRNISDSDTFGGQLRHDDIPFLKGGKRAAARICGKPGKPIPHSSLFRNSSWVRVSPM